MLHSTPIPDRERSTLVQSITINGPNPRRYPKWREFPIETINHPPSIIAEWLAMIGDHFELGCCNCASKRPQLAPHRWSAGVARVPGGHPDSRVPFVPKISTRNRTDEGGHKMDNSKDTNRPGFPAGQLGKPREQVSAWKPLEGDRTGSRPDKSQQ